jgi:hypothetical protein
MHTCHHFLEYKDECSKTKELSTFFTPEIPCGFVAEGVLEIVEENRFSQKTECRN